MTYQICKCFVGPAMRKSVIATILTSVLLLTALMIEILIAYFVRKNAVTMIWPLLLKTDTP